jgi:hypothetical protein
VETIAKIRRAHFAQKKPIKAICREFRVSRKVVRKVIRSGATEFRYERGKQPLPRIDPWRGQLDGLLLANEGKAARERLTLIRIFEELRGLGYAKAHKHPELTDRTIWQVFEAERPQLVPIRGPFDGFHATQAAVSKTCLVRFDNNKYSVASRAVGRPVEIQAYAERIVIRQDGTIVGEHRRCFGRGETTYDPWHYVPVLARKPGALRNGAPFKDWPLPASLGIVRRKLKGSDDGDRQMVKVLSAVLSDGLSAVEAACAEALAGGVHSADIVLNILARHRDPGPAATILTPDALRLRHAPIADCARYDRLRKAS